MSRKTVQCSCCKSIIPNAEITERTFDRYDTWKQENVKIPYYFFRCSKCGEKTEFLDDSEVEVAG